MYFGFYMLIIILIFPLQHLQYNKIKIFNKYDIV